MSRTPFDRDRFQKLGDRLLFYPQRQILRPELSQAFSSDYRRMVAMQLEINGERRDFPDGLTVASLVAHLGMKADRVAVELNRDIVPRNNWDATSLKDGDKLEIVQFVGGGARDGTRAEGSTVAEVENGLSVPLTEDGTWECPSCGMANLAAFCPACGERKASREDYSLRHFLAYTFEAFFHADSKIFRSFALLFAKPGLLAAEYVRGRRKPYLHPLQVFFVANLAYFLLQPLTGWSGLRTNLFVHMHMMSYSQLASRLVEHRIAGKGVSLAEFARSFDHTVDIQARSLVLLMVPIFALALWVLEWGKHRFFGEHLVFALHYYAFWVIAVFLATFGLSTPVVSFLGTRGVHFREEVLNNLLSWIARAGITVYLFLALRTFYKDKTVLAAVKAVLLVAATSYIDGIYRFVLFLTVLYLT